MIRSLAVIGVLLAGCPAPEPTEPSLPYAPVCEQPTPVSCAAGLTADLNLQDAVSTGGLTERIDGNDWITTVDATAGGLVEAPFNPWIYVRFTDTGMQKVEITDLEALDSMEWDLALHRFKLRLNSGVSGPSCVAAAALPERSFAEVDLAAAESGVFETEAFYDETCTFLTDDTGDEGAPTGVPAVVLQDWWTYPDCVATSGIPFAIRLANGRLMKLEVLSFYGDGQQRCNDEGIVGTQSAVIDIRWTFLQ
jgi:hypothetical protein